MTHVRVIRKNRDGDGIIESVTTVGAGGDEVETQRSLCVYLLQHQIPGLRGGSFGKPIPPKASTVSAHSPSYCLLGSTCIR